MSGFVNLDTMARGRFMQNQRLITGVELLPDGEVVDIVKVATVKETKLHVVWEFWRTRQERSYHGQPGEIDLGDIGE